jgi:hypothetical protein
MLEVEAQIQMRFYTSNRVDRQYVEATEPHLGVYTLGLMALLTTFAISCPVPHFLMPPYRIRRSWPVQNSNAPWLV